MRLQGASPNSRGNRVIGNCPASYRAGELWLTGILRPRARASDKFRGFLFTWSEHSSLQPYLCTSGVTWKEPKQGLIGRERACRSQNILLACCPAPRKTAGMEVEGQDRDEASL